LNGEQVDSKNIKKHKNDVFRLAQLITANTRQVLSLEIAEDMKKILSEIADEIRVHPLSFAEYYSAVGGDKNEAFDEYAFYGGMPLILSINNADTGFL